MPGGKKRAKTDRPTSDEEEEKVTILNTYSFSAKFFLINYIII